MTVNLKLSDLMAELTKKATIAYPKPLYAYKSFAILVPERFEWAPTIVNLWNEGIWGAIIPQYTYILHGHLPENFCRNDHFCHVYGYKPPADLNPTFIKAFYKKWTYFNVPDSDLSDSKPNQSQLDLSL